MDAKDHGLRGTLIGGLDDLDWPVGIKKLQQDWIGRSTGAEVDFYIGAESDYESWKADRKGQVFQVKVTIGHSVFTPPDLTLSSATYMVVARASTGRKPDYRISTARGARLL